MPITVIPETGVNSLGLPATTRADIEGVFDTVIAQFATSLAPYANQAGAGAALNGGTVAINNSVTVTGTAGGTLTLAPVSGVSDVLVNMPANGGTVTLGYSGAFPRQRMELDIRQGATPGVIVLNVGTVGGFVGPLVNQFVLTPTAGMTDMLMCIAPADGYTRLVAIGQGYTA